MICISIILNVHNDPCFEDKSSSLTLKYSQVHFSENSCNKNNESFEFKALYFVIIFQSRQIVFILRQMHPHLALEGGGGCFKDIHMQILLLKNNYLFLSFSFSFSFSISISFPSSVCVCLPVECPVGFLSRRRFCS